jgi:hypothetical protein
MDSINYETGFFALLGYFVASIIHSLYLYAKSKGWIEIK